MTKTLTMDDLENMKRMAHYQKLLRESDRTEAIETLAHYAAMVVGSEQSIRG